jgi:hypothetical protein
LPSTNGRLSADDEDEDEDEDCWHLLGIRHEFFFALAYVHLTWYDPAICDRPSGISRRGSGSYWTADHSRLSGWAILLEHPESHT